MKTKKSRPAIQYLVILLTLFLLSVTDSSNAKVKREGGEKNISTYMDRLTAVAMPSQDMTVIVGAYGSVLITRDGGESWERTHITDEQLNNVFFLSQKLGWVVGEKGLIFKTTDGGKTWVRQESPEAIYLFSVRFIDPEKGWIVGYGGFQGIVLFTQDGGRNWEIQYNAGDTVLYGIDFYNRDKGIVVGERGTILVTDDGGKTWIKRESPLESTLFNIKLYDEGKGVIVGVQGKILKTNDWGESWLKIDSGYQESLLDLKITEEYIFLVGARGIFLVSERENWALKRVPLPTKYFISSLDSFNNNSGFFIGAHGTIIKFKYGNHSNFNIDFEMISGTQMPTF